MQASVTETGVFTNHQQGDKSIRLTRTGEIVTLPQIHYVFVEKSGSIPRNASLAWREFLQLKSQVAIDNTITGSLSLYKMNPPVYRAGVSVASQPASLPGTLKYERFRGGKYARFVLTGPYSQLPEATRRVFEIVSEQRIVLRDGYHIENYLGDPRRTPEEKLITEILFPVA